MDGLNSGKNGWPVLRRKKQIRNLFEKRREAILGDVLDCYDSLLPVFYHLT